MRDATLHAFIHSSVRYEEVCTETHRQVVLNLSSNATPTDGASDGTWWVCAQRRCVIRPRRRTVFTPDCKTSIVRVLQSIMESLNLYLAYYHGLVGGELKHWSLFVTPSTAIDAVGTIYDAVLAGDSRSFVMHRVVGAQLCGRAGAKTFDNRLHLGTMLPEHEAGIRENGEEVSEIVNDANRVEAGKLTCQDWILLVVEWLVDARVLGQNCLTAIERRVPKLE
ncbi:hypothetical protein PLICRDRAFT_341774 [Plicaturopsis crispa FD-325 SS-3]|uniref:Uncharacterized protein n=1 Tax=Plicaturopsis crispa FD-325 SS-3 TaxID=944288 RepID=A0A0C9SY50_PLICR|nr:hypothetical protein PLICRDRAFT_341774 [Plicaturopsis crispa FD-325 SS-3]